MKKKLLSILLMVCLLTTSLACVASAAESNDQKDYIIVTRATGEVAEYELVLDEAVSVPRTESNISRSNQYLGIAVSNRGDSVNIPSNNDLFMPNQFISVAEPGRGVTQSIPRDSGLFVHTTEPDYGAQTLNVAARTGTVILIGFVRGIYLLCN